MGVTFIREAWMRQPVSGPPLTGCLSLDLEIATRETLASTLVAAVCAADTNRAARLSQRDGLKLDRGTD